MSFKTSIPKESFLNVSLSLLKKNWFLVLTCIYLIHFFFIHFYIKIFFPDATIYHPIGFLPDYIFIDWDSSWYKKLYENYDRFSWPPLYPLILKIASFLFHPPTFEKSAGIVNLVAHLAIAKAVFTYVKEKENILASPWLILVCLFFFPGHNVFFAAYSESLYLAITLYVFIFRQRNQIFWASFLAGISVLIRTSGSFLCFAIFIEQLIHWIRERDQMTHWQSLIFFLKGSVGLVIFLLWNLIVYWKSGQSLVAAQDPWIQELIQVHIPAGESPRGWIIRYLLFSFHWECFWFWFAILTAIYCYKKKWLLESLYIAIFSFSIFFHTYRPFPWSRFVSVLFPWAVMVGNFIASKTWLKILVIVCFCLISYTIQGRLFSHQIGEP